MSACKDPRECSGDPLEQRGYPLEQGGYPLEKGVHSRRTVRDGVLVVEGVHRSVDFKKF